MAIQHHELEFWLSGGSGNTSPAASLGGARSTAQQTLLQTSSLGTPISGLTLLYASGRNDAPSPGDAAIVLDTAGPSDRLRLIPYPTGNLNGVQQTGTTGTVTGYLIRRFDPGGLVEDRGAARITADWDTLTPSATTDLIVTTPDDALFASYPAADYSGGQVYYRCVYLRNNGSSTLGSGFTLEQGLNSATGLAIAFGLDPAGVNGTATTIANEHTAPGSVSFSTSALSFPDLAAGDVQAVWIRITMSAGYTTPLLLQEQVSIILYDEPFAFFMPWASTFEADVFDPNEDIVDSINFVDTEGFEPPVTTLDAILITDWPVDTIEFTDVAEATVVTDWPEETLAFTDEVDAQLIAGEALTDALTFTDELDDPLRRLTGDIVETLAFTDELASTLIMAVDIVDELAFVDFVDVQGDILDGWVINLETGAASRYSWLRFGSLTRYAGDYYGTTPEGVYRLEGDTDDGEPIDAFVLTMQAAQVDLRETRSTRAYLGIKFTGEMVLKTITKEGVNIYSVQSTGTPAVMQRHRVILGAGVRTVYWQFALQNVEGVDFEADTVWVLPIVLSRRFR